MGRGSTDLDNREYDQWLAENKKEKELLERKKARRNANKGMVGWHFGLGEKPVFTKDREEYKRALEERGLGIHDEHDFYR